METALLFVTRTSGKTPIETPSHLFPFSRWFILTPDHLNRLIVSIFFEVCPPLEYCSLHRGCSLQWVLSRHQQHFVLPPTAPSMTVWPSKGHQQREHWWWVQHRRAWKRFSAFLANRFCLLRFQNISFFKAVIRFGSATCFVPPRQIFIIRNKFPLLNYFRSFLLCSNENMSILQLILYVFQKVWVMSKLTAPRSDTFSASRQSSKHVDCPKRENEPTCYDGFRSKV